MNLDFFSFHFGLLPSGPVLLGTHHGRHLKTPFVNTFQRKLLESSHLARIQVGLKTTWRRNAPLLYLVLLSIPHKTSAPSFHKLSLC